ncbi:MAG: VTT domain-containing protein [Oscillospiraceae bacterium]|nr:VTT domain-containing protein [Oscillospiraceae bacterium]
MSETIQSLGFRGKVLFTALCALQVLLAVIPAGPLELAGGYAFGPVGGTLFCLLGCTLGSMFVYLLVRKLGMPFVRLFISEKKFSSISFLLSSQRWKQLMILCFVIPGAPKDVIAFAAGLTDINPLLWLTVVSLGRLPSILLTVLVGSSAGKRQYTAAVLIFTAMLLLVLIGYLWFRKLSTQETRKKEGPDQAKP